MSTTSSAAMSALALLAERRGWVMPAPDLVGPDQLLRGLPVRVVARLRRRSLTCPSSTCRRASRSSRAYVDISDTLERKAAGIRIYASQIQRLFDAEQGMLDDLAGYHARTALAGSAATPSATGARPRLTGCA